MVAIADRDVGLVRRELILFNDADLHCSVILHIHGTEQKRQVSLLILIIADQIS